MNILRLSTLSLILAIAVMTLGYANPSFGASKKCDGNPDPIPPGCGGADDIEPEFSVEMQQGEVPNDPMTKKPPKELVISDGDCGTTEGENRGASFPDGCVMTVEVCFRPPGPTGCPLTLQLFSLGVKLSKSDVQLFFTSDQNDSVYQTERLAVKIIRIGSSFEIPVNTVGLNLTKAHQPMKGDLVGPIAIGNIVYTPK